MSVLNESPEVKAAREVLAATEAFIVRRAPTAMLVAVERRHLRAVLAALDEATETIGYLRAGLDAMARTINPAAGCAPGCSSWSEDYRINDCDCGYVEAGDDGCAVFAVALLHGEPVLDGCFRDADLALRSAP